MHMKKFALFLFIFTSVCLSRSVFAADDIDRVLTEVDGIQNTIEEKTPDELKGLFVKINVWRTSLAEKFIQKRDAQDEILHPAGEEKKVTFNEEGNIEIETGIGEAKDNPQAAMLFYVYLILAFIFSTIYLFWSLLVLLILAVVKMLFRAVFQKKEA